jgi:hypothetical protein
VRQNWVWNAGSPVVDASCVEAALSSGEPGADRACLYASVVAPYVTTPLLMIQSRYVVAA